MILLQTLAAQSSPATGEPAVIAIGAIVLAGCAAAIVFILKKRGGGGGKNL